MPPQSRNAVSAFAPQSRCPIGTERESKDEHVARFKATQEKFKREREEYFVTTLENARHTENTRRAFKPPPFWS